MKKSIVISLIICIIIGVTVYAKTENAIEAYLVDHKILINNIEFNNKLENPLISYRDRTYISLRDMAKYLNQNVYWYEEDNTISMWKQNEDHLLINSYDTALTIGKAVVEERYADNVNDCTKYEISQYTCSYLGSEIWFEIYVKFNAEVESSEVNRENADIVVNVFCSDGRISIEDKRESEMDVHLIGTVFVHLNLTEE